ncbi:MAG: ABC transporter permease [Planctomycetota bacterium]|jgi:predicted permease
MDTLWQDVKYGVRQLTRKPGFAFIVILTLALSIGASTTLFGALKALVPDPFPFPESDRIVYVWNRVGWPLSVPDFKDIREQNSSFVELGVFTDERYNFGFESPESVYGNRCSAGVLRSLGMRPVLGRWLQERDEQPGAAPVAVIGHSLWSRCFDRDPAALGKTIQLDGQETTVVGIMPAAFEFPSAWYDGHDAELWVPLPLDNRWRGNSWLLGIGRLKPDVSLETADADLKTIGRRLSELYPDTNTNKPFEVRSLHWQMTRKMAPKLRLLFAAVALLMLAACANASGMLLARGTQRQSEFGVRLALGTPRQRVVRLVLTESLVLGFAGCCAGVLFSVWGVALLRSLLSARLVTEARRTAIRVDGSVLLFSVGLAFGTALLAGLVPALTAARASVRETLQESGRSRTGSQSHYRLLRHLTVTQIAAALILAHGALLLSASYLKVFEANRSLDTDQVLTAEVTLQGKAYDTKQARVQFWDRLSRQLTDLPGMQAVGITTKLPLEGGNNRTVLVDDQAYDPTVQRSWVEQSFVTPGYFAAMGIPLLNGRLVHLEDASGRSVGMVINQAMAEQSWPEGNPVGGRIRPNDAHPGWTGQVVGVVGNTRQWGAEHEPIPEMYFPQTFYAPHTCTLVVRASGNASALVPLIRNKLMSLDRNLPLANIRTMKEVLYGANSGRRLSSQLMNTFVGIALVLTIVGIYGTLSYNLAQRQREIGIRLALGALPKNILHFAFSQTGLWLFSGLGIGLAGAGLFSLILRSRVYGINPWHPGYLLFGVIIVTSASLLACYLPARRAARIDPMQALRYE